MIRILAYLRVSGSVPRTRNKQSGVFWCGACDGEGKSQTQYMGCNPDSKATVTTRYGLRGPLRGGGNEEDPELGVFGSSGEKRRIISGRIQKMLDCCDMGIIASEGIIIFFIAVTSVAILHMQLPGRSFLKGTSLYCDPAWGSLAQPDRAASETLSTTKDGLN